MNHKQRALFFVIAGLFVGLSFPAQAQSSFTFQKIVDTDTLMPSYPGTFGGFGSSGNAFSAPTFDGSSLAFIGHNNGAHGYKAVYIVNGGTFDLIVDTNTPIPGDSGLNFRDFNSAISWPISHSGGNVVFWGGARLDPVPTGIYTNIGGSINIVADLSTPIPNGPGNFTRLFSVPAIDGANMVFSGGNDTQEGIYTVIGGTLQVVADLNTPIPGGTGNFDNLALISPSPIVDIVGSDVVFSYINASGTERGIYTTVGGTLRLVADSNTPTPGQNQTFTYLGSSQFDGGDIVFSGSAGSTNGLYLDSGGQLSVLVDTDTPVPEDPFGRTFAQTHQFSANNGRLAFIGSKVVDYVQRYGLYLIIGGDLIKVLDSDDLLDGKTPRFFSLARRGLSGNDIAFKVTFTDGSEGIFVAHFTPANEPPTAEAGTSQSIHVGQTVNLDGSGSSDDNTASGDLLYAWSFSSVPAGSTATLAGANTVAPTFVADLPGAYVVTLVVTDEGGLTDDDEVTISSLNASPNADAGPDQGVLVGELVALDGSGSDDPDFDPITFSWTLSTVPIDSTAVLTGATTATPTFIPDLPGAYVVTLIVNDGLVDSDPDEITVTVITGEDFAEMQAMEAINTVGALPETSVTTEGNQTALGNFLKQVVAALQEGDIDEAKKKLQDALARMDGCAQRGSPDPPGGGPIKQDYIDNCSDQALTYPILQAALDALNGS